MKKLIGDSFLILQPHRLPMKTLPGWVPGATWRENHVHLVANKNIMQVLAVEI